MLYLLRSEARLTDGGASHKSTHKLQIQLSARRDLQDSCKTGDGYFAGFCCFLRVGVEHLEDSRKPKLVKQGVKYAWA